MGRHMSDVQIFIAIVGAVTMAPFLYMAYRFGKAALDGIDEGRRQQKILDQVIKTQK